MASMATTTTFSSSSSSSSSGLVESLLAGLQASVSVLLVITYGGLAAKLGLLSPASTKAVSKVCVRMFLPALLVTKIGSELHAGGSARNYGVVLLWGLAAHFVSFLLGILGHLVLRMPDWVTVGVMFNNTASYPLLLIGALQQTGILQSLVRADGGNGGDGGDLGQAVERANAYFLVFSTVSSCLTFAVGPRLIDSEHAPEEEDEQEDNDDDNDNVGSPPADLNERGSPTASDSDDTITQSQSQGQDQPQPSEETALLAGHNNNDNTRERLQDPFKSNGNMRRSSSFFPSTRKPSTFQSQSQSQSQSNRPKANSNGHHDRRRASLIPHTHWSTLSPRTKWWLLFLFDFFNMPLIGALVGALIGLTPALHRAFFNDTYDGGIFTAWLTASLKNIGGLFVPLPVVIAGTSLYSAYTKSRSQGKGKGLPWGTVAYIMLVRFVLWPVVSIGLVSLLASRTTILGDDPMLWFALMLMPCGPPAMKLITMVQVSGVDEEEEAIIAKLLTISYLVSPVLSFTVVGALKAAQASM